MTIEEKVVEIQGFFNLQVDGYILGDLEILMALKSNGQGFGMCTIPAAMLIISSMEMFGTLLTSSPDESSGSPKYLKQFIVDYIPEISERDTQCLIYNYRHKMMHLFFPKVGYPKMYGVTKKPASNDLINRTNPDRPVLNVVKLSELFKNAIEALRSKLLVQKDESLIHVFLR